jgi:RimJ/RimL family protein N-acetyltransferase
MNDTQNTPHGMTPRPDEVHIASARLSIKPFSADDAEAAFGCMTPTLTRFMAWDPPATQEAFDRIWQQWQVAATQGTEFVFAIRERESAAFLGLTGLHKLHSDYPELGIWIREDRHREGFGREAVSLVAQWATRAFGIRRGFTYPVAEDNRASRRIAEGLGGVVVEQRIAPKYHAVVYRIPAQSMAHVPRTGPQV